ncbi:target of Sbf [Exserohilum turcicum]
MHLRGPMNVSQLAVYQLPGEAQRMQKRRTVPFYNRRRALKEQETLCNTTDSTNSARLAVSKWTTSVVKRTYNTTISWSRTTVTMTKTVTKKCDATDIPQPLPNTTYVGPPLPCFSTPSPSSHSTWSSGSSMSLDTLFQRPNGQAYVSPTSPTSLGARQDSKRQGANWRRVAYYTSSAPAQATGLSFMANLGDPAKSGTFDYAFGNSLSYVAPQGDKVAAESVPFEGTLRTSETEIVVLSDKECDAGCPYWRPNATSHYGWSGSSKAFFIEFQMDHYPNKGTDQGLLSDAPAYWFLNAAIPRALQYGNDRNNVPCSCWSTGCGEFDAFELLSKGAERAKSTIHRQGNIEGGDSNWFRRPVGRKMKFGVVWHYPHITALVLEDDFDFSAQMTGESIQRLVAYDADSWVHSLYAIGD